MGRKRSRSNGFEENKIRKKIAKLQEKLNKKAKRRRIFIESSSSEDECNYVETAAEIHTPELLVPDEHVDDGVSDEAHMMDADAITNVADTAPEGSTAAVNDVDAGTSANIDSTKEDEKDLDSDILELLGDAPKTDAVLGPAIHKDIADRWQEILKKGLTKEAKDKLRIDYVIPNNCDLLLAPELNAEVKAALPEVSIKRDSALYAKQKQIGYALSALALTMERVLKEDSKQNIIKPLSDACRLLCDNHYGETRIRRNFVISTVNPSLKDALINAPRNNYLFGDNVTDKLKAAQTIQKSGDALKSQMPQRNSAPFNKNNFVKRNNLNFQHRKTYTRGATQSARGASTQRPFTRSSARQQPQDRAPPPPPPPPPRRGYSPPRRAPPSSRR